MFQPVETPSLPSFVAEIDRLSDELELFGFPRMLPPEFRPHVYPNGTLEMESVKVLDLLHSLMDSLWKMIQSKHQDRELLGDEGDAALKLSTQLKAMEAEFQKIQLKVKRKNDELHVMCKKAEALKACQKEMTDRVDVYEESIRTLRSQLKILTKSTTNRLAAKDFEIAQLREQLKRGYKTRKPPPPRLADDLIEAEALLRQTIFNFHHTADHLLEENITLQQQIQGVEDKDENENGTGEETQELNM